MRFGLAVAAAAALIAGLGGGAQARTAVRAASAGLAVAAAPGRPEATVSVVLTSVTCIGSSFCWAPGYFAKPHQTVIPLSQDLTEEWNGKTWRLIPHPKGYSGRFTCGGPSFCLASIAVPRHPDRYVVWNGRAWRPFRPQPPDLGVTCVSPTFCVTADASNNSDGVWWNGKVWQEMPQDSGGCGGAWCSYNGIGCASATICWQSGTYCATSDCDGGLIYFSDTWNGTAWNQSAGRNLGFDACAGRAFCLNLDPPTLAQVTNDWGSTWHDATVGLAAACRRANCAWPPRATCGTPHFCLALPSPDPTAALVWNGTTWRAVRLALISGHLPKLTMQSCGSARNCVAIGTVQLTPRGTPRLVVEHWNGKTWQATPIANP